MNFHRIIALAAGVAVSLSAMADLPFRNHRYDSFKATPTQPGQTVFVGNSITNMHSWFEAFGSHQQIIGRGNSGGFTTEVLENLESYIDAKPAKMFLMIGTNDISTGVSAELNARRVMTIIKRVRVESPETEIYVQTILPRSSNAKPAYEENNTFLKEWIPALNDSKVHIINLSEVCAPLNGNSTWSHDGLHPRPIGYAAWCHEIEEQVGYSTVYPETITTQNSCGLANSPAARAEQFPYFPVSSGDVLFFGDEQVHGAEWHELFRCDKIKDRGMMWGWGGINLTQAKNVVASALSGQAEKPSKIFLFYGIGGQDETNYRALVDEAKNQAPEAQIYLVSLSPSTDASTNAVRQNFNTVMQTVATEKGATYVDVYTPLSEEIGKNIMNTNYISGRGYIVMTNELAKHLQEENVNPVTLQEYEEVYTRRNNRAIIGNALTNAYMMFDELSAEQQTALQAAIDEAVVKINKADLTEAEATQTAVALNEAVLEGRMPVISTDEQTQWYVLRSSRDNRVVTISNGGLFGTTVTPTETSDGSNIWKFMRRADGTLNIMSMDGRYISPASNFNTALTAVDAEPAAGWQLSYSNAVSGYFVIFSGNNSQFNQCGSPQSYAIYNWYSPNSGCPDRSDAGCAYTFVEFNGVIAEPEPVVIPEAKVTLLNKIFDGTTPYKLPDHLAAPILSSTAGTVAFDLTINQNADVFSVYAAATDTLVTNAFFTCGQLADRRAGVRYVGEQGAEGWLTSGHNAGQTNLHFVMVYDPTVGYTYYAGGTYLRDVLATDLGVYGFKHFGNVSNANAIYLGGMVTADNANKYPLYGTIHSARFWDTPLNAEQVAALTYDNLEESDLTGVATGISEVGAASAPAAVYDLQGRKVAAPARGLYIVNGKKVLF